LVFHVLNRANGRKTVFHTPKDYEAFEHVLAEAQQRVAMRILAYCVMPNHWHLVLWPEQDGALSRFMHWLTLTHVQRWHTHQESTGAGHLYQGRFKSFPVQSDSHVLTVCRYVERNPLRANLVTKAEEWPWSSLWRRQTSRSEGKLQLSVWPVDRPSDWVDRVNRPETSEELGAMRLSVARGRPFGDDTWGPLTAQQLGLLCTLKPCGRPKKNPGKNGS
jgi:putative transposase